MEDDAPNEHILRNASASAPLTFDESKRRMEEAARWIAGGINSNFRAGIAPPPKHEPQPAKHSQVGTTGPDKKKHAAHKDVVDYGTTDL